MRDMCRRLELRVQSDQVRSISHAGERAPGRPRPSGQLAPGPPEDAGRPQISGSHLAGPARLALCAPVRAPARRLAPRALVS